MLDRVAATRFTRFAQAGAVGALALSAAAVVVALPGEKPDLPPESVSIPVPEVKVDDKATAPAFKPDGTSAGTRMGLIANKPEPAVAPPPPPPTEEVVPPPPVADITYHGIVTIGDKALALLRHNARQRFVKLGDKVGEEPVEEIKPEHVRLGAAHIIPLAERSGNATSRLQSANPAFAQTIAPSPFDAEAAHAAKMAKLMGNAGAPAYVPPEDIAMWRRMRAQMVLSGEYNMEDNLDETAYKMMNERREKLAAEPMTPEEMDAENAYFDKTGRSRDGVREKR